MRAILVLLFAPLLVACASETTVEDPPAAPDPHQGLTLAQASPDAIEGTFTREGISIAFLSTKDTFLLTGANGRTLVEARGSTMRIMDGRATFTSAPSYKEGAVPDPAIVDLVTSKEGVLLPWLSWDLGALGISGRDYPASFMIHSFAMMMAQAHDITLPVMPEKAASIGIQDTYGGDGAWCQAYSNAWGSDCYGMCGKGCSCWHWVCGDCCNHYGCAHHDAACRSCSWSNPGACAACASFSAFFSGGGCAHP